VATLLTPVPLGHAAATAGDVTALANARPLSLSRDPLPVPDRPAAPTAIMDVTKWFGETSGGVKTYLVEKSRWASRSLDVRHTMVIPGAFDALAEGQGTRVYRLQGPRVPNQAYRFLLAPRSLRRIITHERPTVIEVGSPVFVPWVTALATRGLEIPLVQFYHTSIAGAWRSLGLARAPGRLGRGLLAAWVRSLDRLVARTIVASDFAARELAAAGVSRVTRVPLGVDLDHFYPARRATRERTLRRLGLPLDRPLVVSVGRLAPEKRLESLVDAWPNVERATGAHLVIVGSGPLESSLRARCAAVRVTWLPYQHDRVTLANLLAAADLFVAPGDVETFGLAALEALASGVPVVSSATGAVAELVEASGARATFEAGNAASCAHAVREVLARDFASLSLRARSYAEREHDWSLVFARLLAVYQEVAGAAARLHS
jgi:alpha-1,6-mannosyltransferase